MTSQTLQMTEINLKIENISENIGWVFFKIGSRNLHQVYNYKGKKVIASVLLLSVVLLLSGTVYSELELFKIAQNTTSEVKKRQYTTGKVIQHLFSISPCTYLQLYQYITSEKANSESNYIY